MSPPAVAVAPRGAVLAAAQHAARNAPLELAVVVAPLVVGTGLVYRGFAAYRRGVQQAAKRS